MRCEELRELAPEIALGIMTGDERAAVEAHLAACVECRRLVESLSGVTDELLLLAPAHEPPPGFESRVLGKLGAGARPRRARARRLLRWVGPPVVAATVTAAALVAVYRDDHTTAERYRETLEQADGRYFAAAPLRSETGAEAGVAFAYQGTPSWMLVTVEPEFRGRVASGELVTADGRTVRLPSFDLARDGSWGGAIPVEVHDVATIRLVGERPGEVIEAAIREEPGG